MTTPQELLDTIADREEFSDSDDQPPFTDRVQVIDVEIFPLSLRHDGHTWGRTGKVGMTLREPAQPAAEYERLMRNGRGSYERLWHCADNSILKD